MRWWLSGTVWATQERAAGTARALRISTISAFPRSLEDTKRRSVTENPYFDFDVLKREQTELAGLPADAPPARRYLLTSTVGITNCGWAEASKLSSICLRPMTFGTDVGPCGGEEAV
jgi:hypothetical protein